MAGFTRTRDNVNMISPCWIICMMILFSPMLTPTTADLFPFDGHESILVDQDDAEYTVSVADSPLTIAGTSYTSIYVGVNGYVTAVPSVYDSKAAITQFPVPDNPIIAAMWADYTLENGGDMTLDSTPDADDLQAFTDSVQQVDSNFEAVSAVVVTWNNLFEHGAETSQYDVFQVVLTRDASGLKTYAIFNYRDTYWGSPEEVGFNTGEGGNYVHLPGVDYTTLKISLRTQSNVGTPGRYVIRIDGITTCDPRWTLNPSKDACHKVIKKTRKTFDGARSFCQGLGGDLAVKVQRRTDRKHITDLIRFRGHLWIGVEDSNMDRTFSFLDSTDVVDAPFKRGRPGTGSNYCATLKMGRWYDKKCSRRFFFVCEKDPE